MMRTIYNKIRLYVARVRLVKWMVILPHEKTDLGMIMHGMWDDHLKLMHNIKD